MWDPHARGPFPVSQICLPRGCSRVYGKLGVSLGAHPPLHPANSLTLLFLSENGLEQSTSLGCTTKKGASTVAQTQE